MKAVVKTFAVAFAALVVLVSNPLASRANGGDNTKKAAFADDQVSVKYVGTDNNNVVFQVQFDNPTGEKFSLIIKNDNGDVVYHQSFNETHFDRNVYFADTDSDIEPTFIIRNGNNEIIRQFHVTKTVTENTVVTSL